MFVWVDIGKAEWPPNKNFIQGFILFFSFLRRLAIMSRMKWIFRVQYTICHNSFFAHPCDTSRKGCGNNWP
jgi:hypothetical protein